jgi:GNAT superfamily N-acetyltransferase
LRIEPLEPRHDRAAFESGVPMLDRYLRAQAGQDMRRRIASCFVLVDDGPAPLGYYTVAATSLVLADLPERLARRLPRYPLIPATLLGRLAVDHRHRRRGFGQHMLLDAFARSLRNDIATWAIVVDAKDEQAVAFYRAHDFMPLTASGRQLFIPMAEVARLFA